MAWRLALGAVLLILLGWALGSSIHLFSGGVRVDTLTDGQSALPAQTRRPSVKPNAAAPPSQRARASSTRGSEPTVPERGGEPVCAVPDVADAVGGRLSAPAATPSVARPGPLVRQVRRECATIWDRWPVPVAPTERWPSKPDLAGCEAMWHFNRVHYQCHGQPGNAAPRRNWTLVRCCPALPYDVDPTSPDFPANARGLTPEHSWSDVQRFGYPRRALLASIEPVCSEGTAPPHAREWGEMEQARFGNCAQATGVVPLMARVDAAAVSERVVYVDLTSGEYSGVAARMRTSWPQAHAFTEQVLFEADVGLHASYVGLPANANVRLYKGGAFTKDGYLELASLGDNARVKPLGDADAGEGGAGAGAASHAPSGHVRVFDLARVLREDLGLTPKDFVVIKMDIACAEYAVLPHLVDVGAAELVDEVSVRPRWGAACRGARKSRGDVLAMYKYARDGGLYVHDDGQPYLWPGVPFASKNLVHP